MPVQWQSITNKKLHSARLQLDAWTASKPHQNNAYRDAFLLHTAQAYRSLIAEVLECYGCTFAELPDLSAALSALSLKGRQDASEINQLKVLEESDTWVAHLNSAFNAMLAASELPAPDNSRISLVNVYSDSDESTRGIKSPVAAGKVLSLLKEQVLHFRNFNLEW